MNDRRVGFVLAGCHAGHPGDDLPSIAGTWRWFVDRLTGPMPAAEVLTAALGSEVLDWPLRFAEQVAIGRAGPTVLLVRGDPLIATPHRVLIDALRTEGINITVRRRLGIAELARDFAGQRPRVLPASAAAAIGDHVAARRDPLLVVNDAAEQDLERFCALGWEHLWLADLGSSAASSGRQRPASELVSLLLTAPP